LLDFPHYTRPAELDEHRVPEVLTSGNHAAIRHWRKRESLRRTRERRPDLLADASLDEEERAILHDLDQADTQKTEVGA
jgi:tRNA (guanine37-N1)-methyltransferase